MRVFISGLLVLFLCSPVFAQNRKHIIFLKDKANTPYNLSQPEKFLTQRSIDRRNRQEIAFNERDLPVSPQYVTAIQNLGIDVWYTSKWFNAVVVNTDSTKLALTASLPFVKNTQNLNRKNKNKEISESKHPEDIFNNQRTALIQQDYGVAYHQANMIGAVDLHNQGYKGEEMLIAVFDAGFPGVNTALPFQHLFTNNQIQATYNFVDRNNNIYIRSDHGTNVLSTMGAFQQQRFIGTAFKANYCLFITEDVDSEHNIEEVNWLIAAERADSLGVDVINSSLGYTDFDAPSHSYQYADMNGNTTIVTRAADFAASTGILVVNSAGNEGNTAWKFLSAPSDGDSVLSVGAVDSLRNVAGFSSFGPAADGRVKPNLAAQGTIPYLVGRNGAIFRGSGTSFAGPILCGMAACFWQANRFLSNYQVIDYLQKSASQAQNPDNRVGYGIPNGDLANRLAKENAPAEISFYPNPIEGNTLTIQIGKDNINKDIEVRIYNMIGDKVFETDYKVNTYLLEVDLTGAPITKGLYFISISTESSKNVFRMIKL